MRLTPAGPLGRLSNRLSLKVKLIGCLTLVGVALTAAAYLGLGVVTAQRVDERLASRTDDLAIAIASESSTEAELQGVASSLVRLSEVRSIALVPTSDRSDIVAFSANGSDAATPEETGAGALLHTVGAAGEREAFDSGNIQIRTLPTGNPFDPASISWHLVAVELDEGRVAADLQAGAFRAITLMVCGLGFMLLIAFYFIDRVVSRPLLAVARLDPSALAGGATVSNDQPVSNEILLVKQRVATLMFQARDEGDEGDPRHEIVLPDTLPDVLLRIDRRLDVLESRFDVDEASGTAAPSLVMNNLSELLSADVVEHIAATLEILEEGDEESFEFSVGIKNYRVLLRADVSDFTLEISESPAGVHAVATPTVEAAVVLAGLLEHLPVGVLDADERGVVRYANRGLFGASSPESMVGRTISDVFPDSLSNVAKQAVRDARHTLEPQAVALPPERGGAEPGATVHIVPIATNEEFSFFILSVPESTALAASDSAGKIAALEEQLWALELQVSDYEGKLAEQPELRQYDGEGAAAERHANVELANDVVAPMEQLLAAVSAARGDDHSANGPALNGDVWSAVLAVAGVLDDQLGTTLVDVTQEHQPVADTRFHLATMLDEIAIAAGERDRSPGARISAFVQPSLPKWIFGNERESRAAIFQMIEFAQLVSADRPLILAAYQDASDGRSIRVRFELQIPPPMLSDDDIDVLRGCISGEVPDDGIPSEMRRVLEETRAASFDALDIELVKINDEAASLRCSSSFEIPDDLESDQSWVRSVRTLIIQDASAEDNGIQAALGAFGIFGYVVGNEQTLKAALKAGEEYSNPYRLVLADVDTPGLESFVGQLFDGDAPVVLVGKKSESAMVGAISAGYSGYIAKPVRQVDLLEVIMSTVEPPGQTASSAGRASAA